MFDIMQATGFIFDCDGTLLDTLTAWERADTDLFAQTIREVFEQSFVELFRAEVVSLVDNQHDFARKFFNELLNISRRKSRVRGDHAEKIFHAAGKTRD